MFWIALIAVAVFLVYYLLKKPLNYWKDRGVKQGKPWIFFGDTSSVVLGFKSAHELLDDLYYRFPQSRYSGFYQFSKASLLVKDPELIKQITIKEFDHFADHRAFIGPEADPLFGNNLFALKGQQWKQMRNLLSPSFTSSKMKIIFKLMKDAAENFSKFFSEKNQPRIEVDMKDICSRFANDVIASTAFGVEVNSVKYPDNKFYLMGKDLTNFEGIVIAIKFFGYFLLPKIFKIFKIGLFPKRAANFFITLVNETIRTREEKGIVRPDMLHLLLEANRGSPRIEKHNIVETGVAEAQETYIADTNEHTKRTITHQAIVSQVLIFFFAGFDSVSTMMCFLAYELAVNLDIQRKLRNEIKSTFKECNQILTYEALMNMKYMDMVISETMRKWPAPVATDRVCTKSFVIEPVTSEEQTLKVEEGMLITIPTFHIQRDPRNFPEPEKFDPERFSAERKSEINPYTYLPFGLGPRTCIGSRFALLEMKILFFYILLNFEIVPSEKLRIPLKISKKSLTAAVEGGFWFYLEGIHE